MLAVAIPAGLLIGLSLALWAAAVPSSPCRPWSTCCISNRTRPPPGRCSSWGSPPWQA